MTDLDNTPLTTGAGGRLPVLFVGHGSPMNAIEDNEWSQGFSALAALLPRPQAILSVSAHWFVPGTFVTGNEHPETIHDFGGFPQPLYDMQYPASGDPDLAHRVVDLIGSDTVSLRNDWGIDHGTWTVLHHLYPAADIPVIQLSVDSHRKPADQIAIGKALAPLRREGVLIMGSGNIVHNLRHAMTAYHRGDSSTPDWAVRFDLDITRAIEQHDSNFLAQALESENGRISHPTTDHYLPLLYAFGAAADDYRVSFPITGFDLSSLSMRSILFL
jgi:4,5-DOPA dioxygenase extradiol